MAQHSATDIDQQENRTLLLAFVLLAITFVAWFFLYAQPREEFLLSVVGCVGDDTSQETWECCSEEVAVRLSPPPTSL